MNFILNCKSVGVFFSSLVVNTGNVLLYAEELKTDFFSAAVKLIELIKVFL